MNKEYICYCGLYCGACAVKAKIEPAARALYAEMQKAGSENVVPHMPDGAEFWRFLKSVAEAGTCVSCQAGSGDPGCAVRICAQEKEIEICAECGEYPCEKVEALMKSYPPLESDNEVLRKQGREQWAKMQDERCARGFTYSDGGSI